jgi:syntaxin 6
LTAKVFPRDPGSPKGKGRVRLKYTDDPDAAERGEAEDVEETKRWEMEEQQVGPPSPMTIGSSVADRQTLMRRQDDTLGVISGTLHNLASQAGLIGHEVLEQTE